MDPGFRRHAGPARAPRGASPIRGWRVPLLDIVCVLGIIALGAIVALVGRGVEKL
jgi:hypothetical protein